jgi:hypothetical protein
MAIDSFLGGEGYSDWSVPANWSDKATPGSADQVVIDTGIAVVNSTKPNIIQIITLSIGSVFGVALDIDAGTFSVSGATTIGAPGNVGGGLGVDNSTDPPDFDAPLPADVTFGGGLTNFSFVDFGGNAQTIVDVSTLSATNGSVTEVKGGTVLVTTLTNAGALGVTYANNGSLKAVTLTNTATGGADFSNATVTITTLNNESLLSSSAHTGLAIDHDAGDTGSVFKVTGVLTNTGGIVVGDGSVATLTATAVTIGTLNEDQGADLEIDNGTVTVATLTNASSNASFSDGIDVGLVSTDKASGVLNVTSALTNTGDVGIGNGANAPVVTIAKLDNQAAGSLEIFSGKVTVTGSSSNEGAVVGSAAAGIGIQNTKDYTGAASLTVDGTFTNTGDIGIGYQTDKPTVTFNVLDNGGAGSGGASAVLDVHSGTVTAATLDNFANVDVDALSTDVGRGVLTIGALVNSGEISIGNGKTAPKVTVTGALSGAGGVSLQGDATLEIGTTATGGAITFASGATATLKMDGAAGPADAIDGFAVGDVIDIAGLKYQASDTVEVSTGKANVGATLSILNASQNAVAEISLPGGLPGVLPVLTEDASGGTDISLKHAPEIDAAPGDVLVAGVTGQAYAAYENEYDKGAYVGTSLIYSSVPSGAAYSSYAYDYAPGGEYIGSSFDYTGVTGEAYSADQYNYDGGGTLTSVAFNGVTGAAYSSYEYDYKRGVFAGSKYMFTTVPTGATYSSYEQDYNAANALTGSTFVFAGAGGSSYSTLDEEYGATGAYEGYKAFYPAASGSSYKVEEVDVSAANQVTAVGYDGLAGPYSSVDETYSSGVVTSETYNFTDVTGPSFYGYQVTETAGGTALQETVDPNGGGHQIAALATGQTLDSKGDDTMTGDGATNFVFSAIYGADTITNFTTADHVSLPGTEFASLSDMLSSKHAQATSAGGVLITAADGDTLTIDDTTIAALAKLTANFSFP